MRRDRKCCPWQTAVDESIGSGARDEVSRLRSATLHSGGKPRRESGLTKKEPRKCRTGARIRGVKSAEVARGLL